MAMSTNPWRMQADYMESCNCDFGCSCNFSGFPTNGRCEALVGYHVRSGQYGATALDALDFIYAASWPKAIHDGNGTICVYISERAFSVFAPTFRYVLDPQLVPIEMKVDGKRSRFAVPGIIEVSLTPHIDPVLGSERDVRVQLPGGFIWTTAQAAKTTVMRILSPSLNFDHSGHTPFRTAPRRMPQRLDCVAERGRFEASRPFTLACFRGFMTISSSLEWRNQAEDILSR
jgi:hypothetical protein